MNNLPDTSDPKSLLNNLRNVQRFRELCAGLSEKQFPDAFHLWTAEINGAQMFLTTDRKFIRVMTKTKKTNLSCVPVSPQELLEHLNIHELDPFEFKEGVFYSTGGEPI